MSIRLKLTLLYSAILGLALVAFSAAVYLTVARVTFAVVEETLANEAERLMAAHDFQLDHIGYKAERVADPETYIQTVSLTGSVADRSDNLGDYVLPLSQDGWKICQGGKPHTEIVATGTGRLLVYSKPVAGVNGMSGIVQVARSLVTYDESLNTLRNILATGSLIATTTAFGLAWALAGAALRPINRITHTAQEIGAERDFDRRVSYSGPNDEVGRLTTTFNAMLTELQGAYRQMEQSLHAQRRFVADASHELRTPLTTIRGNVGLLERQPPISAEDRDAVIADTAEECDRLVRLINNLLVLARADSGLELRKETVAIKPLIDDVCRQAKLLASSRNVRCENDVDFEVVGDRDALKQVMLILLDNALKYTPPRGTITLAASAEEVDGAATITLQVRDTGKGIPAEALPHIFERFYRVEMARSSGGAGLGLAIARELVEAQGGTITVESEVGQGSRFTVRLPRAS